MKFAFSDDAIKQDLPMYLGKLRFLTVAVAIGVILALGLSIWEFQLGNTARALANLLFPITAPFMIHILWKRPRYSQLVLQIFAFSIFLQQSSVGLYLHDINQMIWIPVFPLVYFYLLGQKGWTWSLLLFIELWLVYFMYPESGYRGVVNLEAMNNFMLAYLVTAVLSWMNSREVIYYQRTISKRAHFDHLTGAYNRVAWLERLSQEIAIQQRNDKLALSILMFDVDDFKLVNDKFGHPAGDKVLVEVSDLISSRLRKSDVLGRWGGEEFVILLTNTNLAQASQLAEELRAQLESRTQDSIAVTASFGITQFKAGDSIEALLQRVDGLLYHAKARGKNCVVAA